MMASEKNQPTIAAGDHKAYMEYALEQARHSPQLAGKFGVGAVLVDADKNETLSTGWSMELPDSNPADPGKPHAEHCCFIKLSQKYNVPEERLSEVLPRNTVLYTTMEPCVMRLSGHKPCVDRIVRLSGSIKVVVIGIKNLENYIDQNMLELGRNKLRDAGIDIVFVEGMEDRILEVSTGGLYSQ